MYTSTEDARSDLFLAGAVFLFGGIILRVLLNIVPLGRIPLVAPLLAIVLPLVTTVLVPFLLIRYRREPWSMYGLASFSPTAFGYGALLGVPAVLAALMGALATGLPPASAVPLAGIMGAGAVDVLARTAQWLGFALLAVYGTVKARDAFRGEAQTLEQGARAIAKILGLAVLAAVVLLLLSLAARGVLLANLEAAVGIILMPLAVATALVIVLGQIRGAGSTTRPTLVTPAVLLGLAGFQISFDAVAFVTAVYLGGLLALLGLLIGVLQEWRRSAWAAIGLMLVIAVLSSFAEGAALR